MTRRATHSIPTNTPTHQPTNPLINKEALWEAIGVTYWVKFGKKNWLLTIIGLALSIPFLTEGPFWLNILIWAITLLWITHVIRSGIREVIEQEQEKPVPLMLIVGRNQDGYRSMKRDVELMMNKTNYSDTNYR